MCCGTATYSANAPWRRYSSHETPRMRRLVAEIDLAAAAEPALAAVDGRVEGDAVAFGPAGDVAAQPGDRAGGLVAHDDRRLPAAGAAVHAVNVAAADAAGGHLQQHVVRSDFRQRPLLNFEMVIGGQYEGFHDIIAQVFAVRRNS